MNAQPTSNKPVDMHIHIVGNGRSGSGCWLNVRGLHRPLAGFMLRHIGMKTSLDSPEFDEHYIQHLLEQLRSSSLGRAVILAQDNVYHENGQVMEGVGSFYVPNDYVLQLARS